MTGQTGELTLDHSGHFIAEEAAARRALEALGFSVTPLSAQVAPDPETGEARLTGTGNICVMLGQGYLEFLLHTADTALGREFRAALERRAGLHLAAFGSIDAAADHARLTAAGVAMRPLVYFSRMVATPEGEERAAFTVARLAEGAMPEGRVQIVTHHNPGALWQPRWMTHPNGARALRGLVVSAPDPEEARARFARVLGQGLAGGALDFLPEGEALALTGQALETGRAAFAALRIGVEDLDGMERRALAAGLEARREGAVLVVPFDPALGRGAWIFER